MKFAFRACAVYFITACAAENAGHASVKDRKIEKLFRGTVHHHGRQPLTSESQEEDHTTVLGDLENEAVKLLEHYAVQDDVAASPDFLGDLGEAEDALRQEGGDLEIIAKIKKARANICVEQQIEKRDHRQCEIFMNLACPLQDSPDNDKEEKEKEKDDDDEEVPVPASLCDHFYLLGGKRVTAPAPAPGPVAGPAASPAGSPGPAAGPSASPGGDDPFAYKGPYFGTKRLRPLQEHGYHGDAVIHEDGETMTSDWQTEFGPAAGHRSFVEICKDFPDNEWCRLHMYDPQAQRWMNQKSGTGLVRNYVTALCTVVAAFALGHMA